MDSEKATNQKEDLNKSEDVRRIIEKTEAVDSVDVEEIHSTLDEISKEKAGTVSDDTIDEISYDENIDRAAKIQIVGAAKSNVNNEKIGYDVLRKPSLTETENPLLTTDDILSFI